MVLASATNTVNIYVMLPFVGLTKFYYVLFCTNKVCKYKNLKSLLVAILVLLHSDPAKLILRGC